MQFHLNGFRTGDPAIKVSSKQDTKTKLSGNLPKKVDVLIIGCGPAGLTLAAQLARFPDIETCIIDQKSVPLELGQADGIACRTMEMFEAFGFRDKVEKEAYWVNETSFWKPDETKRTNIIRSGRIQDTEDGLSEFPHVILNQARVHDFYLESMRNSATRMEPVYNARLLDLKIDNKSTHPVCVEIERTETIHHGETQLVKARYVVGCDGARSQVRKSLGLTLHGDSANQAWGVMDVLALTDFPDIRLKAVVQSANEGSLLIIPREGGYLVRLYIELDKLNENERIANRDISSDHLTAAARRTLHPYSLEVKEIAWWSVYEIGQRLCDEFDNSVGSENLSPNVFITGDACHTHSPKAGQGMNVSMADSFNLGWKLASVIRGQSSPKLLQTYSRERQAIAKELIEFDREFAKLFSAKPKNSVRDEDIDPKEFEKYFVQHGRFTAGTATRYDASIITGIPAYQHLASRLKIGMRFHSAPVVRLADAKPLHLGHALKADGRWRLFAFADTDDPILPTSGINQLCNFLSANKKSPVRKYTLQPDDVDQLIDVRAIFQQGHRELELASMHPFLLPKKGIYGLCDYEKMFCADLKGGKDIFHMRGINREQGCLVIVRPDQHIANILPLDGYEELAKFFDGFMTERVG